MSDERLLYISGSGHSGSTLLDRMLGNHKQISALGEAHRLYMNANKYTKPHYCSCGVHVLSCDFWTKVGAELQRRLGIVDSEIFKNIITTDSSYLNIQDDSSGLNIVEDVPKGLLSAVSLNNVAMFLGSKVVWDVLSKFSSRVAESQLAIKNSLLIYDCVRAALGTPVVVDGTKTPARLMGLYLLDKERFRMLYLVRDGRAVTLSRMARQNISMKQSAQIWVNEHLKIQFVSRSIPDTKKMLIKYEDLCRQPEIELAKICGFLGVEYDQSMLDFRSANLHSLGGNNMRWRTHEDRLRLDEKWKVELSIDDLKVFGEVAGKMNCAFGYD